MIKLPKKLEIASEKVLEFLISTFLKRLTIFKNL
jgi:hypothetical protein